MNYSTVHVRSFCSSRLTRTIMATAGGGAARRKRPWRKPREAKGPEEPLRSVRASPLSYIAGHHVVMEEEAKDKEEQQPQRDEPMALETSGHEQMISRGGDGRRDSKGGGKLENSQGIVDRLTEEGVEIKVEISMGVVVAVLTNAF